MHDHENSSKCGCAPSSYYEGLYVCMHAVVPLVASLHVKDPCMHNTLTDPDAYIIMWSINCHKRDWKSCMLPATYSSNGPGVHCMYSRISLQLIPGDTENSSISEIHYIITR